MKKQLLIAILIVLLLSIGVAAQGGNYTVEAGDTLADIAAWYGVTVDELMTANGLTNADYIFVGQTLSIPGAESTNYGYYTVQSGDTLADIAAYFGSSLQALASSNNLGDVDTIYVGQVLNVPNGGQSTVSVPMSTACTKTYTVLWGDTLSGIALRYGTSVSSLMTANNLYAGTIFAGQQLCVPAGYSPPSATNYYYTVQAGDTVTNIAYRFDVPASTIMSANNIPASGLIYVGQKLLIPGYTDVKSTPAADGAPDYVPPTAPDYVAPADAWDGSVTTVDYVNKWVGARTANFPDPDGNTTVMVRTVGAMDVPFTLKQGDWEMHFSTENSSEFGMSTFGMKGLPAGDYDVWIDQDKSDVVTAHVDAGERILVEFKYVSVTELPAPRSMTGWSGHIERNSSKTEVQNGVWSTIIIRTGVVGLPIYIRSEGNNFNATCYTGTKPEYGGGACDFGGLWPGTYTVGIDGAGIEVKVFVDGQGVAEVAFDH